MSLTIQTEYTDKSSGQKIQLRTPKMVVMGKQMDDKERHEFLILCDGVKVDLPNTQFNKSQYAKYKLFVKYPDQDQAFNLELSQQAYNSINALNPQKWDRLIISKSLRAIQKTGALMPIVVAELIKGDNHKEAPLPNPQQTLQKVDAEPNQVEKEFLEGYIKATAKSELKDFIELRKKDMPLDVYEKILRLAEQRTTTHFIGAYVRNKMEKEYFVMRLEFLYGQWIKNTTL